MIHRRLPTCLVGLLVVSAGISPSQGSTLIHRFDVSADGWVTVEADCDSSSYLVLRTGAELSDVSSPLDMVLGNSQSVTRVVLKGRGNSDSAAFFRLEQYPMTESGDIDGDGRSDLFEWGRPGQFDPLKAEVRRFTQIRGTVVDEAGAAVSGARVQILDTPIPPVVTGPDGSFELAADVPQAHPMLELRRAIGTTLEIATASWDASTSSPVELGALVLKRLPMPTAAPVAAGNQSSMALRNEGELWGWGNNSWGQLASAGGPTPGRMTSEGSWRSLTMSTVGPPVSFGLKQDGSLWAWGMNSQFALGVGDAPLKLETPVEVSPGSQWRKVARGGCTLAIRADGSLWAWGMNEHGQLGGSMRYASQPAPVETNSIWLDVTVGEHHVVAIRSDGSLWSWGNNPYGQLGNGDTLASVVPRRVGMETSWTTVGASAWATVGLKSDGSLWQWGRSLDLAGAPSHAPQRIGPPGRWTQIACGEWHVVALREDQSLWTWGMNFDGMLGNGLVGYSTEPVRFGTGTNWIAASAGARHTVALQSDGSLWSWGNNLVGALGTGVAAEDQPLMPFGTRTNWKAAAAGKEFSLALDAAGDLWAWGVNDLGQLGIGSRAALHLPVRVPHPTPWRTVSCGESHSLAIAADGSLWAWGDNAIGMLGDGTRNTSPSPVRIGTDKDWVMVSAGSQHSFGLKQDGTLWGWGGNSMGQLGLAGTGEARLRPTRVAVGSLWKAISSGRAHTLAIRDTGQLYAWGANQGGQLGNSTTTLAATTTPTRIGTGTGWTLVSAGGANSLASDATGATYVWGSSGISAAAGNPPFDFRRPFRLNGLPQPRALQGGPSPMVLGSNGSLWGWGGLYGPPSSPSTSIPTPLGGGVRWAGVSAGSLHLLLVGEDGSLWIRGERLRGLQGIAAARVEGAW